ncbi:MAG: amidohydrolase family protein [Candidatus Bathycorpusculaceae bacterium]
MVVDSHTHIGEYPLFNVKLDAQGLISIMDEWKIQKALVFTLPNSLTLEAVKKYQGRLYGLVWVNPYEGEEAGELVDEAITGWGFKGLKMHPLLDSYLPDQEIVFPLMDRACRHRVPVLFHCGHPPWSLPWHFGNLADTYPEAQIILGHMGHGHIVYINGAIEVARKHDNVFLETSAMPMHSKIKEAVLEVGEQRVMYGSDTPFGHPAFEIKKVEVAGLTEKQLNLVLEENACRVFRL